MRRVAIFIAVAAFFGLGIVGAACGVTPWVCAMRAVAGAAVLYVLTRLATRIFLDIVVDAALGRSSEPPSTKDRSRERGN